MRNKTKATKNLDMREYIQYHLDLYGLGNLITVKGPERGGSNRDQSWYQLRVVYRSNSEAHHFEDGYIEVYLGYRRSGGYWNRRNIRVAIEKEAKRVREETTVEKVWARAQLAITDGRESDGTFAL